MDSVCAHGTEGFHPLPPALRKSPYFEQFAEDEASMPVDIGRLALSMLRGNADECRGESSGGFSGAEHDEEQPGTSSLAREERVKRTSGVQFPFLASFFKRNLKSGQRALPRTDSMDSTGTHIDRQRSPESADQQVGRGLRVLDLRSLPRDDGPPTELQARREKFAYFERRCSEVAPGICVAGELVARDKALLQENGITHVVNCIGMLCPACFPDTFHYLTLYLNDATGEDMVSLLYDVFAFIEEAVQSGGKVLVHCSQGVSRSATFVIAYLMWKNSLSYDKAYQAVKAIRGVTNPNIGFTCQLLNWAKRRGSHTSGYTAYQIAPHSADERFPSYLVARLLKGEAAFADPLAVILVRLPSALYIWQGKQSRIEFVDAAWRAAARLQRYEDAPRPVLVHQGSEPQELLAALRRDATGEPCSTKRQQLLPIIPKVRLPSAATVASSGDGSAPNSARKTPRNEPSQISQGNRSPNQRQRKVRRSDSNSEGPATARSRSSESFEEIEESLEPVNALELSKSYSPHKRTPRSSRSAHSPSSLRSPLSGSFRHSPRAARPPLH